MEKQEVVAVVRRNEGALSSSNTQSMLNKKLCDEALPFDLCKKNGSDHLTEHYRFNSLRGTSYL